ncbi:uncharacterized protein [Dermacentor albipictus]|uniref:uncharacterized protein n=1 Tax=Dermacentor albipictus TaxID=60249 RepID=UPI0038FD306B
MVLGYEYKITLNEELRMDDERMKEINNREPNQGLYVKKNRSINSSLRSRTWPRRLQPANRRRLLATKNTPWTPMTVQLLANDDIVVRVTDVGAAQEFLANADAFDAVPAGGQVVMGSGVLRLELSRWQDGGQGDHTQPFGTTVAVMHSRGFCCILNVYIKHRARLTRLFLLVW